MAIALAQSVRDGTAVGVTYEVTLPGSPQAGNTQIAWVTRRDGIASAFSFNVGGWTLIRRVSCSAGDDWPNAMYRRVVTAGLSATEKVTGSVAGGNIRLWIAEFSGVGALDTDNGSGPTTGQPNFSFTPTSGIEALIVAGVAVRSDVSPNLTVAGSMTEIAADVDQAGGNGPRIGLYYQLVNPTSGSYTVGATGATNARAVVGASFRAGTTDEATLGSGFYPVLIM